MSIDRAALLNLLAAPLPIGWLTLCLAGRQAGTGVLRHALYRGSALGVCLLGLLATHGAPSAYLYPGVPFELILAAGGATAYVILVFKSGLDRSPIRHRV